MSQVKRYNQFLEHVIEDAQRLDADFRNHMKLWSLMDDYLEEINEAPGAFKAFLNALQTSTVLLTHRLFDDGSIGVKKLIRIAQEHGSSIVWEGKEPSDEDLQEQLDRIGSKEALLERLQKQRHKAYAHIDKKPILDREAFAKKYPLKSDDLREAIDLAHDILQKHYAWKNDVHLNMQITNAVDIQRLLGLVRIGRKQRKQEMLTGKDN